MDARRHNFYSFPGRAHDRCLRGGRVGDPVLVNIRLRRYQLNERAHSDSCLELLHFAHASVACLPFMLPLPQKLLYLPSSVAGAPLLA